MSNVDPIIIIGGGLAGLACAVTLQKVGAPFLLLEQSDGVGGRVRTDMIDGFQLDRGFQVFLTEYPKAKEMLDYEALELQAFTPGSILKWNGNFHKIVDPWRSSPFAAIGNLFSGVGTLSDKCKLAQLRYEVTHRSIGSLPEISTREFLQKYGFSETIIERFFRPFLGGIFFERELKTSSRFFAFVFHMFATGNTTLPKKGMRAIPNQLAKKIPVDQLVLNTTVKRIDGDTVILGSGERLRARAIVLATNRPDAVALSPLLAAEMCPQLDSVVACAYYSAPRSPISDPMLLLNSECEARRGIINNIAVVSDIAKSYSPDSRALISVSIIQNSSITPLGGDLETKVTAELFNWFGPIVSEWKQLKTYRIRNALPDQSSGILATLQRPVKIADRLFVCGDHRDNASINGALESGERAANAVLQRLA